MFEAALAEHPVFFFKDAAPPEIYTRPGDVERLMETAERIEQVDPDQGASGRRRRRGAAPAGPAPPAPLLPAGRAPAPSAPPPPFITPPPPSPPPGTPRPLGDAPASARAPGFQPVGRGRVRGPP